jgi:hypothetical protein
MRNIIILLLISSGAFSQKVITQSTVIDLPDSLLSKANIASPTFTGTVTIPTPFTLGATSVTSSGTKLNYLSAATGTTGTASTNLVYSTSPTLITPGITTSATITRDALATTSDVGLLIQNTTAAAVGAQQVSPSLYFKSFGWGTTAGTSQSLEWRINLLPVQGTVPSGNLLFQQSVAGAAFTTRLTLSTAGVLTMTGNIVATGQLQTSNGNLMLGTAGNKIQITTGSNASIGTATLAAGTVTVSTTAALTASKIFVTVVTPGGTQGFLSVPTITNATSFVINSTSGTETSTVNWWIIN